MVPKILLAARAGAGVVDGTLGEAAGTVEVTVLVLEVAQLAHGAPLTQAGGILADAMENVSPSSSFSPPRGRRICYWEGWKPSPTEMVEKEFIE